MDCYGRDKRDEMNLRHLDPDASRTVTCRDRDKECSSSRRSHSDYASNGNNSIGSKEGHQSPDHSNSQPNSRKEKQNYKDRTKRHSNSHEREKPHRSDRSCDDSIEKNWSSENGKPKNPCDSYKDNRRRNGFPDDSDRHSSRLGRVRHRDNSRETEQRDRSLNTRDRDRERDRGRDRPRERERDFRGPRREDDSDGEKRSSRHGKNDSPNSIDSYEQFNFNADENRFHMEPEINRNESPNSTIMIRGLAQHITENDIRQDILQCSLMPKDIRLIRKKDTGTSRGFAFVEFSTLQEASRWMDMKKGVLMLQDQYRAVMHFSIPKDAQYGLLKCPQDWYCAQCAAHNFKRRDTCFKCRSTREEAEVGEGIEEVTYNATKTILLRGLDALSTIESVIKAIKAYSSVPIVSVRIGQDTLTNASRGLCYIDLNSELDAVYLYDALAQNPPFIDGRRALVSYYRPATQPPSHHHWVEGSTGINPRWLENGGLKDLSQYTLDDVPRLAEYSASLYATTPAELATYNEYYKQYFNSQLSHTQAQVVTTSPNVPENQSDCVNAAAALAQAAIQQAMAAKEIKKTILKTSMGKAENKFAYDVFKIAHMKTRRILPMAATSSIPLILPALPGQTNPKYSVPDVSTYQYDETSGYYYDSQTGLYYDATTQYYFNSHTRQFLYWEAEQQTYLPAPSLPTSGVPVLTNSQSSDDSQKEEGKKGKEKSSDKVKVAKKIAKDMERWAKTLNQKKETFRQIMAISGQHSSQRSVGAADAGYAVLERRDRPEVAGFSESDEKPTSNNAAGLVAAYGGGSDSDDEIEDVLQEEKQHTNWVKLACLLCKRQFDKKETLIKHQQVSELHKQNLDSWYRIRGLDPNDPQQRNNKYRDRAKERRLKFGQPNAPQPNRLKEKYLKTREHAKSVSYEEPTKTGIGSDNVGNKMLQRMGWQEGMGLGKANQGRTSIIQPKQRTATAGLGAKGGTYGVLPGETYKDCVKKMMFARYQELTEQEEIT